MRTRRFKSQALLDEQALAACMAYVDLNPIRAKMAETPEESAHTSARLRITKAKTTRVKSNTPCQPQSLMPFVGNPSDNMPHGLPFDLKDYLELLDWTGRCMREDKRGAINQELPPILKRLNRPPIAKFPIAKFIGLNCFKRKATMHRYSCLVVAKQLKMKSNRN